MVPPDPLDLSGESVISWDDFGVYVDGEPVGTIGQTYGHVGEWVIPRSFTQATIIIGSTLAGPYLMIKDAKGEISHPLDTDI